MGGLFYNGGQKVTSTTRTTLLEMGCPQPRTPIQTDNNTAAGISNSTVKQCRSKAIDMHLYWIRDRVQQSQFLVHWKPGPITRPTTVRNTIHPPTTDACVTPTSTRGHLSNIGSEGVLRFHSGLLSESSNYNIHFTTNETTQRILARSLRMLSHSRNQRQQQLSLII
jgi:hypothetical protein